jgi:hypothetical protein
MTPKGNRHLRIFFSTTPGSWIHLKKELHWGQKPTVIAVETPPSDIEGQFAIFTRTGGIASADRLVSPHYFENAMLFTPFCALDANFNDGVE